MNLNQELRMAQSLMSLMSLMSLRWMLHNLQPMPIYKFSYSLHKSDGPSNLVNRQLMNFQRYSEISLKSFNRCWVAGGMVIITQFICAHHMREISTKHYCNSLFTKAKKKIVFHSKRQLQKLVSIHVVIHDRAFTFLLLPIILSAHILNFLNGINTFALCCWNFSYLRWNDCRLLFLHLLSSTAMNNKTTYKVLT